MSVPQSATTPRPDLDLTAGFLVLRWRRCLVPAGAVAEIDDRARVIGLRVGREAVMAFL